jgi:hypothetical protein
MHTNISVIIIVVAIFVVVVGDKQQPRRTDSWLQSRTRSSFCVGLSDDNIHQSSSSSVVSTSDKPNGQRYNVIPVQHEWMAASSTVVANCPTFLPMLPNEYLNLNLNLSRSLLFFFYFFPSILVVVKTVLFLFVLLFLFLLLVGSRRRRFVLSLFCR